MATETVFTVAEIERIALSRVDKGTREYWSNGAGDDSTVRENISAFDKYRIRPRVLRNVQEIDVSTTVLGQNLSIPIGIAPSGWHKLADSVGEVGTARAAKNLGASMGLSMSAVMGRVPDDVCSFQEVKEAGGANAQFFQLYMFRNRDSMLHIVQQVEKAGYKAIMLTVDTPIVGRRLGELRARPFLPKCLRLINIGTQLGPSAPSTSVTDWTIDPTLVWEDIISWLRQNTRMQIWLKGILTAEDAAIAVKHKVDGIIVSNHGGRQVEGCVTALDALPEIVATVNGAIPVHMDSGIRKGGDIFRALALGADFVWIGRPALWGLAYDGQRGVEKVLSILKEELRTCMALSGCRSLGEIDATHLRLTYTVAKL